MSLGKLIEEALKLCEGIVEAEEALGDLGIRGSRCHEPVDWLLWVIDTSGRDTSVKDMCDACNSEAAKLIRDQLLLPRVQKLRSLLSVEVGEGVPGRESPDANAVKSKRRNKAAK